MRKDEGKEAGKEEEKMAFFILMSAYIPDYVHLCYFAFSQAGMTQAGMTRAGMTWVGIPT